MNHPARPAMSRTFLHGNCVFSTRRMEIPPHRATADPTASQSAFTVLRSSRENFAVFETTRLACDCRITPSVNIFRLLARSVEPVEVMSTMMSAVPAAGAPSVAPRLSTMR